MPLPTDRTDPETLSNGRAPLSAILAAGAVLLAAACGEGADLLLLPGDGQPGSIRVENDGQSGRVGEPLADSISFVVSDSRLRPVNGARIVFDLSSAPGADVVPDTAETNADGRTAIRLVLGTTIGPQVGQARVVMPDGSPGPTTNFTSTALPENANGIMALSGDNQTAPAGTALSQPLVVQVSDAFGNPIAGVPISWAPEGGGTVSAASSQTDADGRASVQRTLGPTAGIQTTLATSEGLAGSPVTFAHTATAGSAAGLSIVSGNEQTAQAGTELPGDLVVRLVDGAGNGVPGAAVTWVVGTGGGRVSPENTVTDEAGRTSSRWTLGPNPGENRVDAVVSGVGVVDFTATGTAAQPAGLIIVTQPSGSAGNGQALERQPVIQVRDGAGNPSPSVIVTAQLAGGLGELLGTRQLGSDANGRVAYTDLAIAGAEGPRRLVFTAGGFGGATSEVIVIRAIPTSTAITSDSPDPSVAGGAVTVTVQVTAVGVVPLGTVTVTDGVGTCDATLAGGTGGCQLPLSTVGNRTIRASYPGSAGLTGSFDTESHRVDATTPPPPPPPPNQPPTAAFSASCNQLSCGFNSAGSNDSDGQIRSYSWNFGDGGSSDQRDPNHVYGGAGSYNVTLTVTDDDGASASVTQQVTPTPPPPPANKAPHAEFDIRCTDMTCAFQDRSTDDDGTIQSHSWTFGDGSSSTEASPSHTYTTPGKYKVTLVVTDNQGATDSRDHDAEAKAPPPPPANKPPHAEFAVQCTDMTCAFQDRSTDDDGTIQNRSWDFGDGTSSTEVNPTHTYTTAGTYKVTLVVTDDRGGTDSRQHDAEAKTPPAAETTTTIMTDDPDPSDPGQQITVTFTVTSGSGTPNGTVQIGDANGGGCTGNAPSGSCSYIPSGSGSRTITATYEGSQSFQGSSDTDQHIVNEPPAPNQTPTAAFAAPACTTGEACDFTDGSSDPDGTVVAWNWDFGDGNNSSEQNPTHVYNASGFYTVKLRVTDNDNAQSPEVQQTVTVNDPSAPANAVAHN